HMVGGRFKMFEALGFKFKEKKPFLEFTKHEEKNAENFIKKNKIKKFIVIHPGGKYVAESYNAGKWPPHLWNLDRYAEVADYFSEKGYKIIITGSKEEGILAEEIKKYSINKKQVIDACGKLSIKESGILLKKASLLIATDTAIIHLAYQEPINAKIVELMGPSLPEVVGAWPLNSPGHKILIDKGPCCRSMRKLPFKNNFNCLENIKVEEVIKAGEKLLQIPS
ncbi:MAG: glycosyltransferase family 9 protein, partial [Nanoarchaeota archaeon]